MEALLTYFRTVDDLVVILVISDNYEQTNFSYSSWRFPLYGVISDRECHDGLVNECERQQCENRELHDRVVGFRFDWFQRLFVQSLEDVEALLQ